MSCVLLRVYGARSRGTRPIGPEPRHGQGKLTRKDPEGEGGCARINRHILQLSAAAGSFALDEHLASGREGAADVSAKRSPWRSGRPGEPHVRPGMVLVAPSTVLGVPPARNTVRSRRLRGWPGPAV